MSSEIHSVLHNRRIELLWSIWYTITQEIIIQLSKVNTSIDSASVWFFFFFFKQKLQTLLKAVEKG